MWRTKNILRACMLKHSADGLCVVLLPQDWLIRWKSMNLQVFISKWSVSESFNPTSVSSRDLCGVGACWELGWSRGHCTAVFPERSWTGVYSCITGLKQRSVLNLYVTRGPVECWYTKCEQVAWKTPVRWGLADTSHTRTKLNAVERWLYETRFQGRW